MLGIRAIASFVPASGLDNIEQAARFDKTAAFVSERIGALFLPRMDSTWETSDLAGAAVESLLKAEPTLRSDLIEALFVVTQNPDSLGLPHTSAMVQHKLSLPRSTAAFDISLGCSGYIYGLYALKGFLEATGRTSGVLVTADPYSKIIDGEDLATALVFGDASTATWISTEPWLDLANAEFMTDGSGGPYIKNDAGRLHMNGRQVMSFAKKVVPEQIRDVLGKADLTLDDVDEFLLHQGSAAVVQAIATELGVWQDRVRLGLKDTGNTVSSTIPLLLEAIITDRQVKTVIASGFGVGLSAATALLVRAPN